MCAATDPNPPAVLVGEGFSAWFAGEYPRLVRTLTAYCGDAGLAGDAASEACTRLYQRWHRRRPDDPGAWAVTTAFNALKRRQRRSALEGRLLRRSYHHEQPTPPDRDVDLWRAVAELPPRMRQAIVLRYVHDLTQQGVAEVMGIAPGTSAALLHKARERLAQHLDPTRPTPGGEQP